MFVLTMKTTHGTPLSLSLALSPSPPPCGSLPLFLCLSLAGRDGSDDLVIISLGRNRRGRNREGFLGEAHGPAHMSLQPGMDRSECSFSKDDTN